MDNVSEIQQVIFRVVEKLKADYNPERIILFGSYAYGTPDRESDLDLLIIKNTPHPFRKRWVEVYEIVSNIVRGIDFSPFVVTPLEFEKRIKIRDQFFEQIAKKGKCLYAR